MRVSLRWLEEYVRVNVPTGKLVELLSLSGSKVEAVHEPGKAVEGVVVAEVVSVAEHPNADNLVLVEVSTGTGDTTRVVCGARNFAAGDKVPLAQVGARLGELAITERRIRGETSTGMLCSPSELGISHDHSGILVLAAEATLGRDVVAELGLDDTILELEVTPNRPDCMGMIGVAREVAALLGNELRHPEVPDPPAQTGDAGVSVKVEDVAGCPRYVAHLVEGLSLGPSVGWVAARLLAAGVRPISNVVDATNYVLLETGQPLHAFDEAQVIDHTIVVRRARRGERLKTLDGVDRALDGTDLVIADPKKALGLAGVMGGESSEVSDATEAVILESAYFDASSIGRTSQRHGLRTEASARFERGTDPEGVAYAAARAAQLLQTTAGARPSSSVIDHYPSPVARRRVALRPQRTDHLLGFDLSPDAQAGYLRSINLGVDEHDGVLEVEVPGFRPDLRREIDLIEEVARLAGFERLPSSLPLGVAGGLDPTQAAERRIRRTLVGFGFSEAWTTSLASSTDPDDLGLPAGHPARRMVELTNPMSENENRMRTSILPGLLRAVARNVAHHADDVALFEMASVFEPGDGSLPKEPLVLAVACTGPRRSQRWMAPETRWDFYALKGVLGSLIGVAGLDGVSFAPVEGMPFHPTRAAAVSTGDTRLGALGELHPDVCARFDVPEGTVALEIAVAALVAGAGSRVTTEDLPRFPAVYLDLAVVVDDEVPAGRVEETVRSAGRPEVSSVRLFDLYRGEQVQAGRKSLAYALEMRAEDRTLTDEDALAVRERIVVALQEGFGATLRS